MRQPAEIYRWAAADGRRGRWLKTIGGAIRAAAGCRYSHPDGHMRVRFDTSSALALWPQLEAEGWSLEKTTGTLK